MSNSEFPPALTPTAGFRFRMAYNRVVNTLAKITLKSLTVASVCAAAFFYYGSECGVGPVDEMPLVNWRHWLQDRVELDKIQSTRQFGRIKYIVNRSDDCAVVRLHDGTMLFIDYQQDPGRLSFVSECQSAGVKVLPQGADRHSVVDYTALALQTGGLFSAVATLCFAFFRRRSPQKVAHLGCHKAHDDNHEEQSVEPEAPEVPKEVPEEEAEGVKLYSKSLSVFSSAVPPDPD